MEWVRFISQGFDYDRWANRQWIAALGSFKDLARAHAVLEHILASQNRWLTRIGVDIPPQQGDMSLQELFDVGNRTWIMVMETADPDELVTYSTSEGKQYTQSIGQIAMHVINHGTYHRGQLRGLAEAEGLTSFPETDLILFQREFS
jgi:uncharacterized damage-inducible protein DinB